MDNQLFLELYNFVDDVNGLIRKLSAENIELIDIKGVIAAIDSVYEIVEREGLSNLENGTTKM